MWIAQIYIRLQIHAIKRLFKTLPASAACISSVVGLNSHRLTWDLLPNYLSSLAALSIYLGRALKLDMTVTAYHVIASITIA